MTPPSLFAAARKGVTGPLAYLVERSGVRAGKSTCFGLKRLLAAAQKTT